jgi:hypothetical protein
MQTCHAVVAGRLGIVSSTFLQLYFVQEFLFDGEKDGGGEFGVKEVSVSAASGPSLSIPQLIELNANLGGSGAVGLAWGGTFKSTKLADVTENLFEG